MNGWHSSKLVIHTSDAVEVGIDINTANHLRKEIDADHGLVEVKLEQNTKEEPEAADYVCVVSITNEHQVRQDVKLESVGDASNGLRNDGSPDTGDFKSTHVKLEPKPEMVEKADMKPKASKKIQQSGSGKQNNDAKWTTKKNHGGHKTLAAKLKSVGAKGRARSVMVASHKKRPAAIKSKKQHKCSTCGYVAPLPYHLKMHILKHTGEKPFSCNICNKRFTWKSNLKRHLKTHTNEYPFICSVCLKRFAQNDERLVHENACNGRHFECHLCKKFSALNKSKLKIHMRMHTGDRPFECSLCSKRFTRKDHLKNHSKVHTNPCPLKFQCSVCARNFPDEVEKDQHELECTNRRYDCYLCKSYSTFRKSDMKRHMRIHHTGVKPFRCEMCNEFFAQKVELTRHIKCIRK